MSWEAVHEALSQPFSANEIEWRVGSISRDKKRAQALAYADSRVYETRLDDVVGAYWSCRFVTWGEQRIICELTLTIDGESITRSSTGEWDSGDKIAQGTTAEAQAFKRACSKFGLGRFLYDLPSQWVGYDDQTKKLTETPRLPQTRQAAKQPAPPKVEAEPKLSAGRAEAMHRELEKLGIGKRDQLLMAGRILEHEVKSFADLSETDALTVWNQTKRQLASA